jgi:hypothetical protein
MGRGVRVMRCVAGLTADWVFFGFCCMGWRWLCASLWGTGAVTAAIGDADADAQCRRCWSSR